MLFLLAGLVHLRNGRADSAADGADDGGRRFLRSVVGDRQCAARRRSLMSGGSATSPSPASSWGFAISSSVSPASRSGALFSRFDSDALRTLTVVTLVFSGQAIFYVSRERRHLWSSRPGSWLIVSSVLDISLFSTLATQGILMTPFGNHRRLRSRCGDRPGLLPGRSEGHTIPASGHCLNNLSLLLVPRCCVTCSPERATTSPRAAPSARLSRDPTLGCRLPPGATPS